MATFTKEFLSGSDGGRPIKLTGTNTNASVLIHTTGTSNTVIDEVWLYAVNRDSVTRTASIQFGGTTEPDDVINVAVQPSQGLYVAIAGLPLTGTGSAGRTINAYSTAANVVSLIGYVNRITP
jgi:hypothetical protein